jgi:hypothetical protein
VVSCLAAFTELWTLLLPLTNIFAWAKTISVSSQLGKLKDWADCAGTCFYRHFVRLHIFQYFASANKVFSLWTRRSSF